MLTSGQMQTAAYMTEGGIVCKSCGEQRIEELLEDKCIDRDKLYDGYVADYTEKHGHAPDRWQSSRLWDDVDRRIEELADAAGITPICEYSLSSDFAEGGCSCDDCGEVLVEYEEEEEMEEDVEEEEEV